MLSIMNLLLIYALTGFVSGGIFQDSFETWDSDSEELDDLSKRVIGGEEIKAGEWPWLVSIQGRIPLAQVGGLNLAFSQYYCGASLLNNLWVLTAAHCFPVSTMGSKAVEPQSWLARLGDIELRASVKDLLGEYLDIEKMKERSVKAAKIIIHPNYTEADLWKYDIALIKLSKTLPTGSDHPTIAPISLPAQGDLAFPTDGQECVIKGWGCTEAGGRVSGKARKVAMPKLTDVECQRFWGIETITRLCAGYNKGSAGVCMGDSGGPLACQSNGKWVQAGITSFTSRDNPGDTPAVFTRVSHYINWIQDTIKKN